jgi:hypothetical protein
MKRVIMLCTSVYFGAMAQDCPPQSDAKTTEEYDELIKEYCENGNGISTDSHSPINAEASKNKQMEEMKKELDLLKY